MPPSEKFFDRFTEINEQFAQLLSLFTTKEGIKTTGMGLTVVGRPNGETRKRNHATTNTITYTEIVSFTPLIPRRFHLAKAECCGEEAQHVQVVIELDNGKTEIVGEGYFGIHSMYIDFFPFGTYLDGDASKKIYIQAKAIDTGCDVFGILQGEEVTLY